MEFNPDGTIKPLTLNHKGVGPLASVKTPESINLSEAKITASSSREPLEVQAHKWGNPKELLYNLPDPLPTRTHSFGPGNAIDQSNSTEWWAAPDDTQKFWQVDLGKVKKLDECRIFFAHPTLGHVFVLEKSVDGKDWQTVLEEKTRAIRSPHIGKNIGKTRFLRIRINEGTPAIWEVKLYR